MPNLKDIKRRIGSVKNTQKITRAMKLVAASKLRRAQEAIQHARPYAAKIHEVVSVLASAVDEEDHELLRSSEKCDKALLLIITSDRGLCGPFNAGLLRRIETIMAEYKAAGEVESFDLIVIGRKGQSYYKRTEHNVLEEHPEVLNKGVNFSDARDFTQKVTEQFTEGGYDRVYLAFNEFKSAIATNQRVDLILPVRPSSLEDEGEEAEASDATEFLFEPDKDDLLGVLLPKYVETMVYSAMLDSVASEHASRMTAMDNATNNASDMIAALTLQYNRARQAAITKELVEITSGAETVNG